MIIKIMAIPKQDEAGNVLMREDGIPECEKEKVFITTKDGRYQRVVTLTDKMAAEVAKGNRYFNAMEKDGVLHITGRVVANF